MKKFKANRQVLSVDNSVLKQNGISQEYLGKFFPRYILDPEPLRYGWPKKIGIWIVQGLIIAAVWIFLRPRPTSVGGLNEEEIRQVYDRAAKKYNWTHHITTRLMDRMWRMFAGWFVKNLADNLGGSASVLDLCTGTGLTAEGIVSVLEEWPGRTLSIVGLDFNSRMLEVAERNKRAAGVEFVRGDATKLTSCFQHNSFDAVVQIFGIGGVAEPLAAFKSVLEVLKPGGQFLVMDMHKPIPKFAGELPILFLWWTKLPILEMVVYEDTVIPLILNRLWGWRDTTHLFYLLQLICFQSVDGRYWGFKVNHFHQESQRWWLGLTIMSTATEVVKKVEISPEECRKRLALLSACDFSEGIACS